MIIFMKYQTTKNQYDCNQLRRNSMKERRCWLSLLIGWSCCSSCYQLHFCSNRVTWSRFQFQFDVALKCPREVFTQEERSRDHNQQMKFNLTWREQDRRRRYSTKLSWRKLVERICRRRAVEHTTSRYITKRLHKQVSVLRFIQITVVCYVEYSF